MGRLIKHFRLNDNLIHFELNQLHKSNRGWCLISNVRIKTPNFGRMFAKSSPEIIHPVLSLLKLMLQNGLYWREFAFSRLQQFANIITLPLSTLNFRIRVSREADLRSPFLGGLIHDDAILYESLYGQIQQFSKKNVTFNRYTYHIYQGHQAMISIFSLISIESVW